MNLHPLPRKILCGMSPRVSCAILYVLASAGLAHAQQRVAGCAVFPADNVWNTRVDTLPVDKNSALYVATIGSTQPVHPDFGSGLWDGGPIGIPFVAVPATQQKVAVTFDYDDESDHGGYPVPPDAPIEGGAASTGDRHVLVVDRDKCILYELYAAYPEAGGSWHAGSGAIFDLKSNALRPAGWTSADAAGLPIFPGLVRYDEVVAGEIAHAIRFTAPQTRNTYLWPARHLASDLSATDYPPMGQRFRLKAGVDISGFSPPVQVILRALKKYGMILADNGSSWYISGAPDDRWNNDVLHEIAQIQGADFEAVDESSLMLQPDSAEVGSAAADFVPVNPCRIADTRNARGAFGGPAIARGASRDFVIPNSDCGIPSTAVAYSLNVAVVPHGTLGYLTAWPAGQSKPVVATLNSLDGRIKSNAAIVPAGANGAISIFATDATDVILDVNGYFVPTAASAGAVAYYPVTPCRIADTRLAQGPLAGPGLKGQGTRAFPIRSSTCGVPANAQAYSLNFAAVPKGQLGYLTVWPAGQPQPLVASLNGRTGTVTANAVIVPADSNGAVDVFATDDTDLVIDINGYFAPAGPGGLSLHNLPPCRVLDTRLPAGALPFNGTRDVNVTASGCGLPPEAQAYVFNATAVPTAALGYITMWPQGTSRPLAATLNAVDGAITSNMAIVPTANGKVSVFTANPTHLVLDIFGYFAP